MKTECEKWKVTLSKKFTSKGIDETTILLSKKWILLMDKTQYPEDVHPKRNLKLTFCVEKQN